jgi:hypothetical protein
MLKIMQIGTKLVHLAAVARRLPLPVVVTRSIQRIGIESGWTRYIDFLHSPDTRRFTKAVDILFRMMGQASLPLEPIAKALPGGTLLEIGCGRHIGFAPFAVSLGAKQYIGVDPALDPVLLRRPAVIEKYLAPACDAALVLADQLPAFKHLVPESAPARAERVLAQSHLVFDGIGALTIAPCSVDVCVSISCLEHIADFSHAAQVIEEICHPNTIHVHLVNFSNHLSKPEPFRDLYDRPYAEFAQRWNQSVNGLRVSDMLQCFAGAGLTLDSVIVDTRPEALPRYIDPYWATRYSPEELAIKTALLTNLVPKLLAGSPR